MGMLDDDACTDNWHPGIHDANGTNITLSECRIDGGTLMALGGAFAGDVTRYTVFAVMLFSAVLTVFGNSAIIICVTKYRRLNCTNYSVYVVSLAVSDVIVGAICIPAMTVFTISGYWPLGGATCTAFIVCDFVCTSTSNMHLNIIAYDRFRAVENPLKYRSTFTKSRARKLALVPWTLSILFYIPGVIVVRLLDDIHGTAIWNQCYYPANVIFFLGSITISTYGPSLCLVFLYIFLMRALNRRNKNTAVHKNRTVISDLTIANFSEREKIRMQNRRCFVTLLAQIGLFLICWVPWMVVIGFLAICDDCVPSTVFDIVYWMVYANSAINPIIYLVFNKDYRTAFFDLLGCTRKRKI